MKSSKLLQAAGVTGAIFLTSAGASAQIENPPSVKGRWGLSAGVNLDHYKRDVSFPYTYKQPGILPMITYTAGKNQFELGPQFYIARGNNPQRFFGANFHYKRYFNGFGNRFVPYLYSGIAFTTTTANSVHYAHVGTIGITYSTGLPYNYKQTGINMSLGFGLEWQMGKHFYLGSSVSLNPGLYSIRKSDFMTTYDGPRLTSETRVRLDFNVNMQFGYRFGK